MFKFKTPSFVKPALENLSKAKDATLKVVRPIAAVGGHSNRRTCSHNRRSGICSRYFGLYSSK